MATNQDITFRIRMVEAFKGTLRKFGSGLRRTAKDAKKASKATKTFNTDLSRTGSALRVIEGPLGGVAGRFQSLGALVKAAGFAVAAFVIGLAGLGFALGKALKVGREFERVTFQINALLKATGGVSLQTAASIEALAQAIDKNTLASTQGVREAAAILLTFKKVAGDAFGRTLRLSQDLASVLGVDIKQATLQLGKALQEPTIGLTMLRRAGISFTAEAKEQIRVLNNLGFSQKAISLILDEIEGQLGGSSKAAAKGFSGALDALSKAGRNMLEQFATVSGVMDVFGAALRASARAIERLANNMDTVLVVASRVVLVFAAFAGFPIIFRAVATAITLVTRAVTGLTVAMLRNPLFFIPTLITGAIALLVTFREEVFGVDSALVSFGDTFRAVFIVIGDLVATLAGQFRRLFGEFFDFINFDAILATVQVVTVAILEFFEDLFRALPPKVQKFIQDTIGFVVTGVATIFDKTFGELIRRIQRVSAQLAADRAIDEAFKKVVAMVEAFSTLKIAVTPTDEVIRFTKALDQQIQKIMDRGTLIETSFGRERKLQKQLLDLRIKANKAFLTGTLNARERAVAEEQITAAVNRLRDALRALDQLERGPGAAGRGAKEFFAELRDEATNTAKIVKNSLTNAFRAAEDAFVDFVTTGKVEFRSLVNSILADLLRLQFRKAVLGIFGGIFPDLFAGAASHGGIVGALPVAATAARGFQNARQFRRGGFAGSSGGDNVPVLAKRGEAIFPTVRLPNGKLGIRGVGGGGVTNIIKVVVQVDSTTTPKTNADAVAFADQIAKTLDRVVLAKMQEFTRNELRPGGILNQGLRV